MYIYIIILLVVFLFRRYLSNEYFTSLNYYLKMKYLATKNRIVLKEKLVLDGPLKTDKLCIDGYCITDQNLGFMSEIPYRYPDKILYKNKDGSTDFEISEKDLYRLNHYWFEGQVVWYYGNIKKIPKGWALCDGNNDTPDLRDKFVVGTSDTIKMGEPGGKEKVVLTEDDLPNHSHRFNPYMLDTGNNYYKDASIHSDNICPDRYSIGKTPDKTRCPAVDLTLDSKKVVRGGGPCCYASWKSDFDSDRAIPTCENAGGYWVNTYFDETLCSKGGGAKICKDNKLDFWKNPYVCMMPNKFKKIQYQCPDKEVYWVGLGTNGLPLGTGGNIVGEAIENAPFDLSLLNSKVDCSTLTKTPEHSKYNSSCLYETRTGNETNCKSFIPLAEENTLQGSGSVKFEPVGGGKSHNNMPPYYGLYYIIKLKKKETN